jgi:hypothetical protein
MKNKVKKGARVGSAVKAGVKAGVRAVSRNYRIGGAVPKRFTPEQKEGIKRAISSFRNRKAK